MNREEFLRGLWGRLSNRLPRQELDNVMRYYEEYFDEAGPEREGEVLAELGSPERVAAQIMGDRQEPVPYDGGSAPVRRRWTGGQIALAVCLSPLWAPLALAVLILAAGLTAAAILAAAGLTVGLIAAALGLGAAGVGMVGWGGFLAVSGFSALFTPGVTTTMVFGGFGLLWAGGGVLALAGCLALLRVCGKAIAALWRGCCRGVAAGWRWLLRRERKEAAYA